MIPDLALPLRSYILVVSEKALLVYHLSLETQKEIPNSNFQAPSLHHLEMLLLGQSFIVSCPLSFPFPTLAPPPSKGLTMLCRGLPDPGKTSPL